jgi:hypothetical protein
MVHTLNYVGIVVPNIGELAMQITRHWRLNATRYRLQGVCAADGSMTLQAKCTTVQPDNRHQPHTANNSRVDRKLHIA